jgi:hypothetical protein
MGGRRVGFGGGFKLLPGAEEARSNEAELEVEDFFYFFFGCALEKKMFGVWTGFGARARRRFPARIWRRGARVGLVGGKKPTCGPRCQSVGLSAQHVTEGTRILPSRAGTWAPDVSATSARARVRLGARQAGIEERAVQAFGGCGLDFLRGWRGLLGWGGRAPYDWLVRTATSVRGIRFSFFRAAVQGKEDAATAIVR